MEAESHQKTQEVRRACENAVDEFGRLALLSEVSNLRGRCLFCRYKRTSLRAGFFVPSFRYLCLGCPLFNPLHLISLKLRVPPNAAQGTNFCSLPTRCAVNGRSRYRHAGITAERQQPITAGSVIGRPFNDVISGTCEEPLTAEDVDGRTAGAVLGRCRYRILGRICFFASSAIDPLEISAQVRLSSFCTAVNGIST